jgi:hypothetical protein
MRGGIGCNTLTRHCSLRFLTISPSTNSPAGGGPLEGIGGAGRSRLRPVDLRPGLVRAQERPARPSFVRTLALVRSVHQPGPLSDNRLCRVRARTPGSPPGQPGAWMVCPPCRARRPDRGSPAPASRRGPAGKPSPRLRDARIVARGTHGACIPSVCIVNESLSAAPRRIDRAAFGADTVGRKH